MTQDKVEKITVGKTVAYIVMWSALIVVSIMTCGRPSEPEEAIIINDGLVMFDSDHFVILPQEPDTLEFIVVGPVDDNTLELYCITDSTTQYMEVESSYIPQYYDGVVFKMIKGQ